MSRACRAGIVTTVVLLAGAVAAADRPGAFAVAALRRDGVIVPFAAFDGKRWSRPWPAPAIELTVPVDLRAVPSRWWGPTRPLDVWQARLVDAGAPPRPLRVVQPDWIDVPCARQIALRTDYVAAGGAPPPATHPYPKDGLAVSPPHAVEAIAIVAPDAPNLPLSRAVMAAFNQAERAIENQARHPISRRAREGVVPTIEAIYTYGDQPRIYYIEATRPYRQLGQAMGECAAMAFATGWFVQEGDQIRSLLTAVDLLSCDRVGASYMLPLGVVREGGRLFWLAQFSGWDHERFMVAEIKKKTVEAVLSAWEGSC
jgi:hypothetical protein